MLNPRFVLAFREAATAYDVKSPDYLSDDEDEDGGTRRELLAFEARGLDGVADFVAITLSDAVENGVVLSLDDLAALAAILGRGGRE